MISFFIMMLLGLNGYCKQLVLATIPQNITEKDAIFVDMTVKQVNNMKKLCKVWGFVKYTHQSFILGLKDWDAELINLIPLVCFSDENIVNEILYNWLKALNNNGYQLILDSINFKNDEVSTRQLANIEWIEKDYLGDDLSIALLRLYKSHEIDRSKAPVYFNEKGTCVFLNEKAYINMDFTDYKYRLLGLFRLWNAMEYYFPYRDILEDDWNELLYEFITKILEGTDSQSYISTLTILASKLHDAHINIRQSNSSQLDIFTYNYGDALAPVKLTVSEKQLVVKTVDSNYGECPLLMGDIILRLNGIDIKVLIKDMLKYVPYPNDENALSYLIYKHDILRQKSHIIPMTIDVLRDDLEMKLFIKSFKSSNMDIRPSKKIQSHELLDNNIGLINPGSISSSAEIHNIMKKFDCTDGLIIDLRQYPRFPILYQLSEYLLVKKQPFAIFLTPIIGIPGVFKYSNLVEAGGSNNTKSYFYEKEVVILMDIMTVSQAETTIMALRNGPNVHVMGKKSMGANGDVANLPLPGGFIIYFSGFGVYYPDGSQTQCLGLSPDIFIEQSLAGIRNGIDEFLENAIRFITK